MSSEAGSILQVLAVLLVVYSFGKNEHSTLLNLSNVTSLDIFDLKKQSRDFKRQKIGRAHV